MLHNIYTYIYVHVYTYIYIYMYMGICVCVYMYMYIHTYIHTYMYICIHMHIQIYTNIYTYIHVYIYPSNWCMLSCGSGYATKNKKCSSCGSIFVLRCNFFLFVRFRCIVALLCISWDVVCVLVVCLL